MPKSGEGLPRATLSSAWLILPWVLGCMLAIATQGHAQSDCSAFYLTTDRQSDRLLNERLTDLTTNEVVSGTGYLRMQALTSAKAKVKAAVPRPGTVRPRTARTDAEQKRTRAVAGLR
jgi:hypothetical protein